MANRVERQIGGKSLTIETGKLALQSNAAVAVSYGETVVLVTVCMAPQPREGVDFLPLTVDYEERLYAAGKIPGSFFRREGRPSQEATLASRLTDRSLRPLLPKGLRNDIQVVVTVLSVDKENDPDILSIIGASAALSISEIPFNGPIGACRVGKINDEFVINPTFAQLADSKLDLVVASTRDAVMMVEAGARQVSESMVLEAIAFGQKINKEVIDLQEELVRLCGKPKKAIVYADSINPEAEKAVSSALGERLTDAIFMKGRREKEEVLTALQNELLDKLGGNFSPEEIIIAFQARLKAEVRESILKRGIRPDGRGLSEIRPIACEVGVLPRTHGSGLFSRGQTQVITITTLGSTGEEQLIDSLSLEESKRFIHHYNFPPYSTGETRRIGTPGRREIGHGALVERSLQPVIPSDEEFPYTIRLVSEVLSSNGSTSMASVCAGILSLMDAGVPIKAAVAGAAMGLIVGEPGSYAILTDIAGNEDAFGDMDFKVAGTAEGITALQMDIKVGGISFDIMGEALGRARDARLTILDIMKQTISASRPELSPYAPRMTKIMINKDKIGSVIGPGGKTIRSIIEATGATIDVENDGTVLIGSTNEAAAKKAQEMIESLTKDVEVGAIYTGKVTRVTNFGAFVEVLPGKEGLVHISELAEYRVPSVEDVVKVGDEIMVMVTEIDRQGRINLSRKAVYQGTSTAPGARARGPMESRRPERGPEPRAPYRPREEGGRWPSAGRKPE
ncbi:MAG: polyribonucleotide nucleotidyltransferase [Chloroflexi bacterium]|nr:polyribonucleotide nucleotidyltransferase [Chloroflexota bacterium]